MQKFLARLLIVFLVSGVSSRAVCASTDHVSKQLTKFKMQLENIPVGTVLKVKRKDHSEVAGELIASSEEGFELAAPEPINITYAEVKSVTEDPNGQATPRSGQSQPQHHSHIVRNVVIGVAVMCALAVIFAGAAK